MGGVVTGRLSKTGSLRPVVVAGRYGLGRCGMVVMVVGGGCLRCAGKRGDRLFINSVSSVVRAEWFFLLYECSPFSTAFHRPDESSLERLIMPLAVPLRRKSASLTLLINASFITRPPGSRRTRSSTGQSLKWTVRRHGYDGSSSWDSSLPVLFLVAGSIPA